MTLFVAGPGAQELAKRYEVAFAAAGWAVDCQVGPDDWTQLEPLLRKVDCTGAVLTGPVQLDAYEQVDIAAASAKLSGGVSLVIRHGSALLGFNTAGTGLAAELRQAGFALEGARVALLGDGCFAASCVSAFAQQGAASVALLGQVKERSREVMERVLDAFSRLSSSGVDLPGGEDAPRSFRQAYELTDYKFGSRSTSTACIQDATLVVDVSGVQDAGASAADDDAVPAADGAVEVIPAGRYFLGQMLLDMETLALSGAFDGEFDREKVRQAVETAAEGTS